MQSPRKKQRPPRLSTKLSQLQMLLHMSFKTKDVKLHITRFAHRVDPGLIVRGVCVQARILRAQTSFDAARERVLARTPHQTLFWHLSWNY